MREKRFSPNQCSLGVPGVPRSRAGFTAAGRDAAGRFFAQRHALGRARQVGVRNEFFVSVEISYCFGPTTSDSHRNHDMR